MFMGMGIGPEEDATLHELLQPIGKHSVRLLCRAVVLMSQRSTWRYVQRHRGVADRSLVPEGLRAQEKRICRS